MEEWFLGLLKGTLRGYHRDSFPHSLLRTRELFVSSSTKSFNKRSCGRRTLQRQRQSASSLYVESWKGQDSRGWRSAIRDLGLGDLESNIGMRRPPFSA